MFRALSGVAVLVMVCSGAVTAGKIKLTGVDCHHGNTSAFVVGKYAPSLSCYAPKGTKLVGHFANKAERRLTRDEEPLVLNSKKR